MGTQGPCPLLRQRQPQGIPLTPKFPPCFRKGPALKYSPLGAQCAVRALCRNAPLDRRFMAKFSFCTDCR